MFQKQALLLRLVTNVTNNLTGRKISNNVGFIGLGNMGAKMASHLIKKGRKVKVYDVSKSAAQSIQGAQICNSPKEAAEDNSIVITMLPDGEIVKEVLQTENGILKGIKKNSLFIDCSTIEPKSAQELAKISKKNSIRFLDAPVSGGVTGAAAATLTFMVGGDAKDVEEAKPYLLQAGAKVFHCGDYGAGQVAKLCNNLILAATMVATAESLNMGTKLGLDPKVLTDIVNVSTGRSWTSETYNPYPGIVKNIPPANNYEGGFMVKLVAKDLGLAENAALQCNAPVPMTALSHQLYRTLISQGFGDKDFAYIYQFLKGVN
ncbi:probable 3-hydroxyisobutyrate dehydrogenase, mitochondrial [Agrilus planipennis]|uniref:3-hydroxyisobutyrate dehydrogenase n=1 Tax=Agrilus planipennis TaxID=224129 RepID=A0A1W4XMZ5_AGRPL|nr:probable 3-hydroxyisobutyrate dehydrogenase, mitochondrial [Agrilus planipennis]